MNLLVIGTSNAIIRNGYPSYLIESGVKLLNISLGDTNTLGLTSALSRLPFSALLNERFDAVILESFINDSLQLANRIVDIDHLRIGYQSLAHIVSRLNVKNIIIVDLKPAIVSDVMRTSPLVDEMIAVRSKELGHAGITSYFTFCESDESYNSISGDPFHFDAQSQKQIASEIAKATLTSCYERHSSGDIQSYELCDYIAEIPRYSIDLLELLKGQGGVYYSLFKSSLLEIPVFSLEPLVNISINVVDASLVGIGFVSSLSPNAFVRIRSQAGDQFFSANSSYPKSILRFAFFKPIDPAKAVISHESSQPYGSSEIRLTNPWLGEHINESLGSKTIELYCLVFDRPIRPGEVRLSIFNENIHYSPPGISASSNAHQGHGNLSVAFKRLRPYFTDFWPGFNPLTDYRFSILSRYFNYQPVSVPGDANILFVSVWCKNFDLSHHDRFSDLNIPMVLYTAEHDNNGLPGYGQLHNRYSAVLSHYRSSRPNHVWLPNAVGRLGWHLFSRVNYLYSANRFANKLDKCLFVYSNPRNAFRNILAEKLKRKNLLASYGKLLNDSGVYAPADTLNFIEFASRYSVYLAIENSSHPFYSTEKIFTGLATGSRVAYWGDPYISSIVGRDYLVDLGGLHDACDVASLIVEDAIACHADLPAVPPFVYAADLESDMLSSFIGTIGGLIC